MQETLEAFPWKIKGRRELLNLECSINYDAKGVSSKRGKGKTHLRGGFVWVSGFVVLSVLGLRDLWVVRVCGCFLLFQLGFLLLVRSLLYILPMYLGVPYIFFMKLFLTYQKKKKPWRCV
jgi:hypothetical protein